MKHLVSSRQWDKAQLEAFLMKARWMKQQLEVGNVLNLAHGKILAALFYEPSTRTRLSFESAMLRLGGHVISETDVTFSSQFKGESLSDTIRMVSGYSDVIALRSRDQGSAQIASEYSTVPVINAGDGSGEHPTQALLDLFTIHQHFLEKLLQGNLNVTFVGDLKHGRTVNSLLQLVDLFGGTIRLVSPPELALDPKRLQPNYEVFSALTPECLQATDVLYVTRLQHERLDKDADTKKLRTSYSLSPELAQSLPPSSIILHPLPRLQEIPPQIDDLPQACYFEQAYNGLPVRMALIAHLLNLKTS